MKHIKVRPKWDWKVLGGTKRSQAALLIIPPGESEGGPDNRHSGDQWLYVLAGTGSAHVGRKTIPLSRRSLLLIAKGETHTSRMREIRTSGSVGTPGGKPPGATRQVTPKVAEEVASDHLSAVRRLAVRIRNGGIEPNADVGREDGRSVRRRSSFAFDDLEDLQRAARRDDEDVTVRRDEALAIDEAARRKLVPEPQVRAQRRAFRFYVA